DLGAAAVVAPARVALGVLVAQGGAERGQHLRGADVLARDELQPAADALQLAQQDAAELRVEGLQRPEVGAVEGVVGHRCCASVSVVLCSGVSCSGAGSCHSGSSGAASVGSVGASMTSPASSPASAGRSKPSPSTATSCSRLIAPWRSTSGRSPVQSMIVEGDWVVRGPPSR